MVAATERLGVEIKWNKYRSHWLQFSLQHTSRHIWGKQSISLGLALCVSDCDVSALEGILLILRDTYVLYIADRRMHTFDQAKPTHP